MTDFDLAATVACVDQTADPKGGSGCLENDEVDTIDCGDREVSLQERYDLLVEKCESLEAKVIVLEDQLEGYRDWNEWYRGWNEEQGRGMEIMSWVIVGLGSLLAIALAG